MHHMVNGNANIKAKLESLRMLMALPTPRYEDEVIHVRGLHI